MESSIGMYLCVIICCIGVLAAAVYAWITDLGTGAENTSEESKETDASDNLTDTDRQVKK